jgi:hypothetical protein
MLINHKKKNPWVTPSMEFYSKLVGIGCFGQEEFKGMLHQHHARESTPQEDKLLQEHHHLGKLSSSVPPPSLPNALSKRARNPMTDTQAE